MALNPLQASPPMAANPLMAFQSGAGMPAGANPLQAGYNPAAQPGAAPSPMGGAPSQITPAQAVANVHGPFRSGVAGLDMTADELKREAELAAYNSEAFSTLAKKPDIKPKDVIKVATNAMAEKLTTAEKAVKFITEMPTEQDKLHNWVRGFAAISTAAAVHLQARLMKEGMIPMSNPAQDVQPVAAIVAMPVKVGKRGPDRERNAHG